MMQRDGDNLLPHQIKVKNINENFRLPHILEKIMKMKELNLI